MAILASAPSFAAMPVSVARAQGGAGADTEIALDAPLFLEVAINGRDTDLIAEFRSDAGGRLSSPASELSALGLDVPASGRLVALDSIPRLDYRYDALSQRLEIDLPTNDLAPQILGPVVPQEKAADGAWGLAVNYDASLRSNRGLDGRLQFDGLGMAFDAWAFAPLGRLETTGFVRFPFDDGSGAEWTRYETVFQRDLIDRAMTVRAGDTITSSLSWGRAVRLGGLQVQKDFSLRRDLVTAPMLSYGGTAAVPSTVDVFVDGNRVFSGAAEPGRFRLDNVPVQSGPGRAIVTVRGLDGEIDRQEVDFFGARDLLRPGTLDFSAELGRPRLGYGIAETGYLDAMAGAATLRYGLSSGVTLSGHVEGIEDTYLVGFGADFVAGRAVEISLAGGGSRDADGTGRFGELTFAAYPFGWLSAEASFYRGTSGLADLALAIDRLSGTAAFGPPRARDVISLGFTGETQTFGISYIRSSREIDDNRLASIGYARSFPGIGGTLSLTGSHDLVSGDSRFAVLFGITRGRQVYQAQLDEGGRIDALVSRAISEEPGSHGYAAQVAQDDDGTLFFGRLERETRFGRAAARLDAYEGRGSAALRFQGAVAAIDRKVAVGRRIRDGFAIVDAGRPGVPVRLQNREVAMTGPGGKALVSGLISHHSNRLSMDVDDIPHGAVWESTAAEVVPARRSGVAVDFGVSSASRSRLVTLVGADGAPISLGTPVVANGRQSVFGVGYDGQVFVEDVSAGDVLVVGEGAAQCRAVLPPASRSLIPEAVSCR